MKAKLGHIVHVGNKSRKFGSTQKYLAVHVNNDGEEIPLLLTYGEFTQMQARAAINKEDMPEIKRPWWYWIFNWLLG